MGVGIMRDEEQKSRDLNTSHTLGYTGKTYSKSSSGHTGGRRPGQTRKKPKDLIVGYREECGRGEVGGVFVGDGSVRLSRWMNIHTSGITTVRT